MMPAQQPGLVTAPQTVRTIQQPGDQQKKKRKRKTGPMVQFNRCLLGKKFEFKLKDDSNEHENSDFELEDDYY